MMISIGYTLMLFAVAAVMVIIVHCCNNRHVLMQIWVSIS